MKAIDIAIGAKVRADNGGPVSKRLIGTVVANQLRSGDEVVVVEWDNNNVEPININDVDVITESQLEGDFSMLTAQIKTKMNTAAHAIKESQKMAILNGYDLHGYDLQSAIEPLMDAMDEVGWCTSSLVC